MNTGTAGNSVMHSELHVHVAYQCMMGNMATVIETRDIFLWFRFCGSTHKVRPKEKKRHGKVYHYNDIKDDLTYRQLKRQS